MENKFECEYDELTDADRHYLRQPGGNEKPGKIEKRIALADGLELVAMRSQNECWTLTGNPNFPDGLTFDVREIKNAVADSQATVIRLPLNDWLYNRTLPGCDEPHIAAISPERMDKLGIIVMLPDNTICMIDGNHRLCARWRSGLKEMRVAILNYSDIQEATFVPGTKNEIKIR
jgi:hypothetical protein